MKLPVIRELAKTQTLDNLRAAENALIEGLPLPIEIDGADEGEQLTHILGAIAVIEEVAKGADPQTALREYAVRVRNSIG